MVSAQPPREHALDLVVAAFGERQAQAALAGGRAGHGARRDRAVVEHHAVQQPLDLRRIQRVARAHLIDFGHMAPG
jgi:hypothetical protein